MEEVKWSDFEAMVTATGNAMDVIIDDTIEGLDDGTLAGRIPAYMWVQSLAEHPEAFAEDFNNMLTALGLPYRLFKVTGKDGNSVTLEVGGKQTVA
jgi:hypothetical protein